MIRELRIYLSCVLLLSLSIIGVAHVLNNVVAMKAESETTPLCLRGRVVKVELMREDKHSIVFDVKLRLEFINTGDMPIIILQREFWLEAKRLARSAEDARANKYLYLSSQLPSVSTSPEWKELRRHLNQPSPPPDLTRVLAPGESLPYETNATLYIEKAGSFDKTSQSWDTIKQASPVWLQVTLEMWAVNIEPRVDPQNLEFGKMLQRRWQQVGKLQLESLTSEPMPLDFSSLTLSNTAR